LFPPFEVLENGLGQFASGLLILFWPVVDDFGQNGLPCTRLCVFSNAATSLEAHRVAFAFSAL
jgi:hypothetical protein